MFDLLHDIGMLPNLTSVLAAIAISCAVIICTKKKQPVAKTGITLFDETG